MNNPPLSFKKASYVTIIIVISFIIISLLIQDQSTLKTIFSDLSSPLIEILVISSLFYAAYRSSKQGTHMQIAWTLLGVAILCYAIGDVIWGVLELGYNQNPFPSLADIFYLLFYPFFVMGVYFFPREHFNRLEELKIILEMGIMILTVGLILWIFLIEPNISSREDFLAMIISITYVIGDFILLFAMMRLIYSKFKEEYYSTMLLLGLGIIALIISDCIYSYQNLQGTYISGGLLDTGWIIGMLLVGLASFLHTSGEKYDFYKYIKFLPLAKRSSFITSLPLFCVLIAFVLLFWANNIQPQPHLILIKAGVGIIILMVVFRQLLTEKALVLSEKSYRDLVDNSLVGIYKTNLEGNILFANESLAKIFEFESVEDFQTRKTTALYKNPETRNKFIYKLKKEGKLNQYELEMVSNSGNIINMLISANLTGDIISGMLMDITRRKNTEKALKDNEEKYHTLFESNPNYTMLLNLEGVILDVNSVTAEFIGIAPEKLIGKKLLELGLFPKVDVSFQREKFSQALKGDTVKPFQYKLINKKGEYSWVQSQLVPIKKDGGINSILVIATDITERKKAIDNLKSSVNEKEILIKEIHHRVKNNMQIISSLLSLQSQHLTEDEEVAQDVLKESQNRVKSMAMIHEKLYQSKDFTHIKFEDYIKRLISNLFYSYDTKMEQIKLRVDVEDIDLNMETAIPCGLIISELFSNSLKYAFPEGKSGEIRVSLKKYQDNEQEWNYILTVQDNGIGLPADFDFRNTRTLGLELVNSLTKQIDGTLELDRNHGTTFKITFKELKYKQRL
ncbi:PAS domain S-box protein [Methanobacterium formicicum]|uniref:Signal transduction histidine kinase n=1 Tax=Methanobacterium formicicum (strain DSM 3637 / PP1) TaxID=1204725 RepID=K2RT98_METFP|nr:PAS domain S-box protein [Methanobacterium formicicum]EKF85995.1 signal transduction histidine kinase [Methanobacterium formicicum DSM 3637]